MSTTSPREAAAADMSRVQAQLGSELASTSYPLLQRALQEAFSDFNSGQGNINSIYDKAGAQMKADYGNQSMVAGQLAQQQAKQSGYQINQGQVDSRVSQNRYALGQQQYQDTQNLEYQRMGSQLSNYNSLMGALGMGANQAIGISQGFAGNQQQGLGMLSNTSQMGSTLAGAASGASLGAAAAGIPSLGIGALAGGAIGGVIGGAAGYFGYGG